MDCPGGLLFVESIRDRITAVALSERKYFAVIASESLPVPEKTNTKPATSLSYF